MSVLLFNLTEQCATLTGKPQVRVNTSQHRIVVSISGFENTNVAPY